MADPSPVDTPSPSPPPESSSSPWWRRYGWGALQAIAWVGVGLVLMQVVGWLRAPALPELAPDFRLVDVDGAPVHLAELRGKPVVLNFWATWCGPCRIEAPSFSRFASANPDVVVLGLAEDGPAPRLKRAAADLGITYRVAQVDRATLRAYQVSSFPTTVVVDRSGRVRAAHVGLMLDPQIAVLTWGL